jgi:hypothetical protein
MVFLPGRWGANCPLKFEQAKPAVLLIRFGGLQQLAAAKAAAGRFGAVHSYAAGNGYGKRHALHFIQFALKRRAS